MPKNGATLRPPAGLAMAADQTAVGLRGACHPATARH